MVLNRWGSKCAVHLRCLHTSRHHFQPLPHAAAGLLTSQLYKMQNKIGKKNEKIEIKC